MFPSVCSNSYTHLNDIYLVCSVGFKINFYIAVFVEVFIAAMCVYGDILTIINFIPLRWSMGCALYTSLPYSHPEIAVRSRVIYVICF